MSKSKSVLGLVLTWLICVSPAAFADPVNGAAHAAAQACNPGNAVFCGLLGGGGGAGGGAGGAAAAGGGAGAGGAGGAGGAASTTSMSSAGGAGGAASTTSVGSAGGAGGGSAGTSQTGSGQYSGGSGSGTSKLGGFVFVAVAALMIYVMYMDHKCRRTPGCKPDPNLPTTNAVDSFGDTILTAWNTGPYIP
jgi:hypothetical protein